MFAFVVDSVAVDFNGLFQFLDCQECLRKFWCWIGRNCTKKYLRPVMHIGLFKFFTVIISVGALSSFATFHLVGVIGSPLGKNLRSDNDVSSLKRASPIERCLSEEIQGDESGQSDNSLSSSDHKEKDFSGDKAGKAVDIDSLRDEIMRQEHYISRVKETVSSIGVDNISNHVVRAYQQEAVDYGWAMDRENRLVALFNNDESLLGFYPDSIGCRSANCEIVLSLSDKGSEEQAYRSILSALMESGQYFHGATLTYVRNPKNAGHMVMYLSKEQGSILFSGEN